MLSPIVKKLADKAPYVILDSEPPRSDNAKVQVQLVQLPKKQKPGSRSWMRFDSSGASEFLELDKHAIMRRASVPARDLRILNPVFSEASHILARESAMVLNLEFIKALVTAEELFLLDATEKDVVPFVDQLKEEFPLQSSSPKVKEHFEFPLRSSSPKVKEHFQFHLLSSAEDDRQESVDILISEVPALEALDTLVDWSPQENTVTPPQNAPFEFRVLEIALDVVCKNLEGRVSKLEKKAYPKLDELTRNITPRNLELVRNLKSELTRLTAKVQKVRDELEHLMDDDDDMADLHLTRKLTQDQHIDSPSMSFHVNGESGTKVESKKPPIGGAMSIVASLNLGNEDAEELEMLLDAYFIQLDGALNKLMAVREYIHNTEDYINIHLDYHRNQVYQFHLILTIASLAISFGTAGFGMFGMNIQIPLYQEPDVFLPFVMGALAASVLLFLSVVMYVYWTVFEK